MPLFWAAAPIAAIEPELKISNSLSCMALLLASKMPHLLQTEQEPSGISAEAQQDATR
jgi:hypothetical protein